MVLWMSCLPQRTELSVETMTIYPITYIGRTTSYEVSSYGCSNYNVLTLCRLDGERLVDLAWNPGWDEEEREQWDFAMKSAAQEQSQDTDQSGSELTRLCEDIIAKHAMTWSEQALVRNCQQLS